MIDRTVGRVEGRPPPRRHVGACVSGMEDGNGVVITTGTDWKDHKGQVAREVNILIAIVLVWCEALIVFSRGLVHSARLGWSHRILGGLLYIWLMTHINGYVSYTKSLAHRLWFFRFVLCDNGETAISNWNVGKLRKGYLETCKVSIVAVFFVYDFSLSVPVFFGILLSRMGMHVWSRAHCWVEKVGFDNSVGYLLVVSTQRITTTVTFLNLVCNVNETTCKVLRLEEQVSVIWSFRRHTLWCFLMFYGILEHAVLSRGSQWCWRPPWIVFQFKDQAFA